MTQPFNQKDIPASANGAIIADLGALLRNYRRLKDLAAPAECAAVVKANGYGLGAVPVARALSTAGCRTFFVATLDEALELRAGLPEAVIYVLDGLLPGSAPDYSARAIRPVLGNLDEIAEWSSQCLNAGQKLPAALHIDTGMNRLGVKGRDLDTLADDPECLSAFGAALVMSHLACGDTPDNPKNSEQRAAFLAAIGRLPPAPASLANSAGVFFGEPYHFDLVRPGIALYGGNPFSDRANPVEPTVRLYGRIVQIGEARAGETIGYGGAFTVTRNTRFAAVAIGYADGFFRSLGSSYAQAGAAAYLDGSPVPVLGRVSMDLTVFDVTDLPQERVKRGGFLELIGQHFTADDAGARAGTMAYEILTSLSRRCKRIYIGGPGDGNA